MKITFNRFLIWLWTIVFAFVVIDSFIIIFGLAVPAMLGLDTNNIMLRNGVLVLSLNLGALAIYPSYNWLSTLIVNDWKVM